MTFIPKVPSKSLCKSVSLINDGVGEKPKPFSRTLISVSDNTFLLRLNTESEEKEPLMYIYNLIMYMYNLYIYIYIYIYINILYMYVKCE